MFGSISRRPTRSTTSPVASTRIRRRPCVHLRRARQLLATWTVGPWRSSARCRRSARSWRSSPASRGSRCSWSTSPATPAAWRSSRPRAVSAAHRRIPRCAPFLTVAALTAAFLAGVAVAKQPGPVIQELGPVVPTPQPSPKAEHHIRLITSLTLGNKPDGDSVIAFEATDFGVSGSRRRHQVPHHRHRAVHAGRAEAGGARAARPDPAQDARSRERPAALRRDRRPAARARHRPDPGRRRLASVAPAAMSPAKVGGDRISSVTPASLRM